MAYKQNVQERVILNEKLITINLDVKNKEEALTKISEKLFDYGYVKENFVNAVIEREKIFPTGISTINIGVAIPHTDKKFVNKASISIGILNNPVVFNNMSSNDELQVSAIFMLAIKEPQVQLGMLKRLMSIFQDNNALKKIMDAKQEREIFYIMKSFLGNTIHEI